MINPFQRWRWKDRVQISVRQTVFMQAKFSHHGVFLGTQWIRLGQLMPSHPIGIDQLGNVNLLEFGCRTARATARCRRTHSTSALDQVFELTPDFRMRYLARILGNHRQGGEVVSPGFIQRVRIDKVLLVQAFQPGRIGSTQQ